MARYSLHGGHNSIVQGANFGNRKEHVLDRQVKDAVAAKLRSLGHTVYDDTDEVGATQSQNLNNIIRNSNSHAVDLVISFHLNASDGNGQGVEVLYYDQKDLAAKISAQLAKDIGWRDRGAKQRTDLAVLISKQNHLSERWFCLSSYLWAVKFLSQNSDEAKKLSGNFTARSLLLIIVSLYIV
ncbi:N-acetylmuramoyl-L-alanine amidase [Bacillus cereus]|nr:MULTISPECIES: N-acetylmuramoyl-L-alanine amidase [Bacillus cereus group]MCB5897400.1 N-acetylmuramoyl-L-alanine amidase [Bacillus cereus]MDA2431206.1 N-acetylmuramoyl-L-alanine amidase [Bacillus cereus]MDW4536876.1 N-acetylmuramoyl-L-alanine amidase [Bacillus cereus]MDZ4600774.1 N-acetylmuramoyl-L-alanine amidase [Bacillus cereus]